VNINVTVPPAGTPTSSPPLSPIFLPPQILNDSCNNRIDYFDSLNSTTFDGTYKTELINYLDDKTLLSLFVEMNGTIETQSVVEGVMGFGFDSPIWNQLVNDDYLQVIGIALPNFICSI
ncbi:41270_t:CDS:2, partial [Gigaspora margarita]